MDYKNKYIEKGRVILDGVKNFEPSQVLDNGQAFRWKESEEGWNGVVSGAPVFLRKQNDVLILSFPIETLENFDWVNYFDLNRDYSFLKKIYSQDKILARAVAYSPGLRLMRQDIWETLISFILSQNCNIKRIKGMIEALCKIAGEEKHGVFAFPTPEALASLDESDLAPIKAGYRAPYLVSVARSVSEKGFSLELEKLRLEDAEKALRTLKGVGPKVANCVLLFALGKVEFYPNDVWMRRIMKEYYPKGFSSEIAPTAGIAAQYLFHYARNISDF